MERVSIYERESYTIAFTPTGVSGYWQARERCFADLAAKHAAGNLSKGRADDLKRIQSLETLAGMCGAHDLGFESDHQDLMMETALIFKSMAETATKPFAIEIVELHPSNEVIM